MSGQIIDLAGLEGFVRSEELKKRGEKLAENLRILLEGSGAGSDFTGWLSLPEEAMSLVGDLEKTAEHLRESAPITVLVGIGGSYLGARAVIEALKEPFAETGQHTLLYAGHHLGEDYHAALIRHLKGKNFNIVVISKSGTTTEPALAFRLLRNLLEENMGKEKAANHIVAITDRKKGALHTLATKEGYTTFVIPDNVGGRYSVFTPVGLLPVTIAGLKPSLLLKGARKMAAITRDNNDPDTNPAIQYAAARNELYSRGFATELLANYEPALHYVSEWWKQLFGESEGKDGTGIFPASVDLTTDLHSMGQYIQDGPRKLFETVLSLEESRKELRIPFDDENADQLNFIAGKRFSEVNRKAEEGTIMAHREGGVPVIRLVLPVLNEENLGGLLYLFEISCAISGYSLGVNPFDQPGVEAYKRNMFRLLGKE